MLESSFWVILVAGHLLAGVVTLALAIAIGRSQWNRQVGRLFTAMVATFAVWVLGSLVRLFVLSTRGFVAVSTLKWIGVTLAPAWFLLFSLAFADHDRWITRRTETLLLAPALGFVLLVGTTTIHGQFYAGITRTVVDGYLVLEPDRGPMFWGAVGYGWTLVAIGTLVLLVTAFDRAREYYAQSAIIIVAIGFAWLTTVIYLLFDWPHPAIDPTPLAFAVSSGLFALGIFTTRLVDVVPVARNQVLEAIDDPVIVLDAANRPLYLNGAAKEAFSASDRTATEDRDRTLERVAAGDLETGTVEEDALTLETPTGPRVYRAHRAPVRDHLGQETGVFVYLNDVTDIHRREQRIAVLNRILRHNIRNDLTVTIGHLELLRPVLEGQHRTHLDVAVEHARRVADLADRARDIERTLDHAADEPTSSTVAPAALLDRLAEEMHHRFPDAAIETAVGQGAPVTLGVPNEQLIDAMLAELVENAIEHNDRDAPTVRVETSRAAGVWSVSVVDDGPPIPADEIRQLRAGLEESLEHGSGLGLWLVAWTVATAGGDLTFDRREPRGNVVTAAFPLVESR